MSQLLVWRKHMTSLESIARKITGILFAGQSLASAGFIAAATLNSIVGKELSGHSNWAGVPSAPGGTRADSGL
jgi:hypothetical protein